LFYLFRFFFVGVEEGTLMRHEMMQMVKFISKRSTVHIKQNWCTMFEQKKDELNLAFFYSTFSCECTCRTATLPVMQRENSGMS